MRCFTHTKKTLTNNMKKLDKIYKDHLITCKVIKIDGQMKTKFFVEGFPNTIFSSESGAERFINELDINK